MVEIERRGPGAPAAPQKRSFTYEDINVRPPTVAGKKNLLDNPAVQEIIKQKGGRLVDSISEFLSATADEKRGKKKQQQASGMVNKETGISGDNPLYV